MYDVNYFIEKFEEIPESRWCKGSVNKGNKHCAVGHCNSDSEYSALYNLPLMPMCVNDGIEKEYQQPTPKKRILAALYDIRDKELSEANVMAVKEIVNENNVEA